MDGKLLLESTWTSLSRYNIAQNHFNGKCMRVTSGMDCALYTMAFLFVLVYSIKPQLQV